MVRSTDDYHINVFIFQHLAVVLVLRRTRSTKFEYIFGALIQYALVHIAEGHTVDLWDFEVSTHVGPAHPFTADYAVVDLVIGSNAAGEGSKVSSS